MGGLDGQVWLVHSGDEPVGEILIDDADFPWLSGGFTPAPAFGSLRELFARELALTEGQWELVHDEIRRRVSLTSPDGPVPGFRLHIEGDRARFRWGDKPFDEQATSLRSWMPRIVERTVMQSAAGLIAETYALGDGPWTVTPVTRGALGQIWKMSGPHESWAVKELLFGCDQEQVRREAALRNASEKLGISAPRLLPNRDGTHVSRLAGSHVKLYDWVEGTEADPSEPELLSWCGRTLAILHRAGEGTTETPDDWYEQCPQEADWARLHKEVRQAQVPWSDELGRFLDTRMQEPTRHVTRSGPGGVVISHLDMQPQNVLVGPAGPTLVDWDNAGPIAADRELAHAVYMWAGGNDFSADAARLLVRAYRDAGGPAVVRGLDSFSMLFVTALNFVYVQAECAIDPNVTDAQREFASGKVVDTLATLPDPAAIARLTEALAG